jgi:hypothetical protein
MAKAAKRLRMAAASEKRVLSFLADGTKAIKTTCKIEYMAEVI